MRHCGEAVTSSRSMPSVSLTSNEVLSSSSLFHRQLLRGSIVSGSCPFAEMMSLHSALCESHYTSSARLSHLSTITGYNGRLMFTQGPQMGSSSLKTQPVRSLLSSGHGRSQPTTVSPSICGPVLSSSLISARAAVIIRRKKTEKLAERIADLHENFMNALGQGIVLQLVSEEIDPVTKSGKRSVKSAVRGWFARSPDHPYSVEYAANFTVPSNFGRPGAVLISNFHPREFYLMEIVLHGFSEEPIVFPANTWIHSWKDDPGSRFLFSNQIYLPSATPCGLKDLREAELICLRGNGKGERKKHERVYDYAPYNDLGNPDKDGDLARPVLGGTEKLYPRRCRTGRPPSKSDPLSEGRVENPHSVYVPRDETFEESKQATFSAGLFKALLHTLVPSLIAALSNSDNPFKCFTEIDQLYKDGILLKTKQKKNVIEKLLLPVMLKMLVTAGENLLKYEIPAIISRDRFAWLRDSEFARQTLAGVNPVNIERLKEFPICSKLNPSIFGSAESALTKTLVEKELNGISLEEAIKQERLYILDYHDLFMPFIKKICALEGRKAYATRTLFFLDEEVGSLRPVAIELSLPPTSSAPLWKRVYTHGHDATAYWTWKLAKSHVCSNDAVVHQLVNHWLRTHACMEPYIIATHRQLSCMHPIYRLLHLHMRYTMEINALARQALINGGGVVESCFSPGKYSVELSSAAYESMWRFDMEALPADLIRRGMAVEDSSKPCGVRLLIEDYPYAADGLLIWSATKEWVEDYVNYFYSNPGSVISDYELHAWWDEIKSKGHADKKSEKWWPKLQRKEDLSGILTIMIWTASGQHAAINFGQYPFGGYVPNRPSLMRRLIPQVGEPDYEKLLIDPQHIFLSSMPTQLQATKVMAVQDTLSTHSPDEEYLGQDRSFFTHWNKDREILNFYEKFRTRLEKIEEIINERNRDLSLKNRTGAGVPPYELLLPSSGPGVTGRGIPNSISI